MHLALNLHGRLLVEVEDAACLALLGAAQAVGHAVLAGQVIEVHLRVELAAGDRLQQVVAGCIEAANLVDVLVEPSLEWLKVSSGDVILQRRKAARRLLVDLARSHGAQRVRGKVAEGPSAPVHVLQAALRVRGRSVAQVLLHAGVPRLRHLRHLHAPLNERLLDLVANDDVQRVGHLVALRADVARLHDLVQLGVERVGRGGRAVQLRQPLQQPGQQELHEGPVQRDHALPQQRLALVDAHRHGGVDRQPVVLEVAALLVQRVAGLVDCTCQALHDIVCLEPSRHADIGGMAASGERVHADVQAAHVRVEAKIHGNVLA
mmetsp:Transcript_6496/g.16828  ORF Transcript_6496/g.16828 Transcript_6496/m.16828 type:complete len:320 (+) Transcript_6496:240-1199(+)